MYMYVYIYIYIYIHISVGSPQPISVCEKKTPPEKRTLGKLSFQSTK